MAGPLRWEWRTFGEGVKPAEGRFAALSPDAVQESDERYVLSLRNGDTVKVRDKLLDVKRLVRVNDDGLEQWEPALKAEFPVAADLVRSVVDGLHAAVPALERSAYTEDELFDEVVGPSSDLVAVDVHKTRRRYTIGGLLGRAHRRPRGPRGDPDDRRRVGGPGARDRRRERARPRLARERQRPSRS